MNRIFIAAIATCGLLSAPVAPARAQSEAAWDDYLEIAYELTWGPSDHIRNSLDEVGITVGQDLENYATEVRSKLAESGEVAGIPERGSGRLPYEDVTYRNLAVAELLLFLETGQTSFLQNAVNAIDRLQGKKEAPMIAFWFYFIHSLDEAVQGNAEAFVDSVFELWREVILFQQPRREVLGFRGEVSGMGLTAGLPHIYRNLTQLVRRGIIDYRLEVEPLGTVILAIEPQMRAGNYGADPVEQPGELEQWVSRILRHLNGDRSDAYNLNFAAAYLEAEEYRTQLETGWSTASDLDRRQSFVAASELFDQALAWAVTPHGRASAMTPQLKMINFVLERSNAERAVSADESSIVEPEPGIEGFTLIAQAGALFGELVAVAGGQWQTAGFPSDAVHRKSAHELWNAIMAACILTADFYDDGSAITAAEFQRLEESKAKSALTLYMRLFDKHAGDGASRLVPNTGYHGAVLVSERLALIYERLAPFSKTNEEYDQAFRYWMQSIELFPLHYERILDLAERLRRQKRLYLFADHLQPLANRMVESSTLYSLASKTGVSLSESAKLLQHAIPQIIRLAPQARLQANGNGELEVAAPDALRELVQNVKQEIPSDQELIRDPTHPFHDLLKLLYQEAGDLEREHLDAEENGNAIEVRGNTVAASPQRG